MIFLALGSKERLACRINDKRLYHAVAKGTLTMCPEGALCTADADGSCDALVLIVPKETLSFAMAEQAKAGTSVVERLKGQDWVLLRLGFLLARQVSEGSVDGQFAWQELTDSIAAPLIDAHLSEPPRSRRGVLDQAALARVIDCVHDRMRARARFTRSWITY